ncbi:MAG: LPS export ABC transporter permease LptG [Methyloversatilis sp.]|jgi:lipopolysaccharide export system permease protein|uniref:Permease n=1 Tax=Methyloversatilis universalis (strain ATCC BAA-1314 / DSM 25237 / JCM 13912 / CCUG 52030 / FAM5) TaxID=1000565 RepID=F5RDV5_METUF|nr:LPS export ABC transporter permease LptG [Methyloversatilis universalis]EGK71086.1 Putative permease [Methyloversatilis universalis FAM5]MCP4638615.1 LPS export ABC transporter permease LptG [Methyloversatilis sp.]
MLIHERYVRREVALATLLVLTAFLGLFGFFDLINELDNLGRGNYGLEHAVMYTVLTLPGRAYETLPIAVLIGALYSLTTLSRHSEITVLRASGLSTARILKLLARIGLPFVLLTFATGEFIAPPAERAAQELKLAARSQLLTSEFRSGFWVKDGRNFINIGSVTPDGELRKVRIFEFNERRELLSILEAGRGAYRLPDGWVLAEVARTDFSAEGARVTRAETLVWDSELSPDVMSVMLVVPERMSAWKLWHYIQHLADNHQDTGRYEIALWKKFTYPLACLVMLALALPFAYMHNRNAAVSIKVFAGVMIGVLFHMLNGLFSNLGAINSWPPYAAALTPGVLFMFAAAAMLWWEDRR